MVTPEEDKERIERARAKARVVAQERDEAAMRFMELWDKGINPRTGEAVDPAFKRKVDELVAKDMKVLRRREARGYEEGRGTNRVRSRKGGRNRKVRRG